MGINSTEVSYGFGQLGSIYQNLAKPIFPPKDHVIVAIQFLGDNIPTVMLTEQAAYSNADTHRPKFPGTTTSDPEFGVCESAVSGAGSTVGVVTIAANTKIKVGQYIIIGADADTADTGITLDTGARHVDPVYSGPNAQGLVVQSISGTRLTISYADGSVFNANALDASNTLYFLDEHHGVGGTTTTGAKFPKGLTIYGRWTKVVPAEDTTGGVICYFGK